MDRIVATSGAAPRDIRLWVGAEEVAHRALFGVPWLTEHLARLVSAYSTHLLPDPEKLMKMFNEQGLETEWGSQSRPDCSRTRKRHRTARPSRRFLTVTSGYSHLIAKRGGGISSPTATHTGRLRGRAGGLRLAVSNHERVVAGAAFVLTSRAVRPRGGRRPLDGPERLPTMEELADPWGGPRASFWRDVVRWHL